MKKLKREQDRGYFPIGNLYYLVWHGFLIFSSIGFAASLAGYPLELTGAAAATVAALNFLAVTWFLPSFLSTFCLHFVSSNMHYYGDVDDGNIMRQTQVLNPWWLLPFQAFCCNFGATHAIHHFVIKEPFYIRQWNAPAAHKVMREMGVRFNDVGTFRRANGKTYHGKYSCSSGITDTIFHDGRLSVLTPPFNF